MTTRSVVVMGRVPRAGRVKTRLQPAVSPEHAAALYRAFLLDVFALVEAAAREAEAEGLSFEPFFACALAPSEPLDEARALAPKCFRVIAQRGADLGQRMANAREDAGAEQVVIIGSDSPTMPPRRIVEAFTRLSPGHRAVLGPTLDGGYDLIGLSGRSTNVLFEGIPWSTPAVLDETRRAAERAKIQLIELAPGYDIDCAADLTRALEDARRPGSLATRTREAIERLVANFQLRP